MCCVTSREKNGQNVMEFGRPNEFHLQRLFLPPILALLTWKLRANKRIMHAEAFAEVAVLVLFFNYDVLDFLLIFQR